MSTRVQDTAPGRARKAGPAPSCPHLSNHRTASNQEQRMGLPAPTVGLFTSPGTGNSCIQQQICRLALEGRSSRSEVTHLGRIVSIPPRTQFMGDTGLWAPGNGGQQPQGGRSPWGQGPRSSLSSFLPEPREVDGPLVHRRIWGAQGTSSGAGCTLQSSSCGRPVPTTSPALPSPLRHFCRFPQLSDHGQAGGRRPG